MKVKIINCLFALCFFLVVAGRNIPSTPLSPDVNIGDPPLHHILPPPPPPSSIVVNCGDVISQTPSLSKPPSTIINCGDAVPQSPPSSKTMEYVYVGLIIFVAIDMILICCAIYHRH